MNQITFKTVQGGESVINLRPAKRFFVAKFYKALQIPHLYRTWTTSLSDVLGYILEKKTAICANFQQKSSSSLQLFKQVIREHVGAKLHRLTPEEYPETTNLKGKRPKKTFVVAFKTPDFRYVTAY